MSCIENVNTDAGFFGIGDDGAPADQLMSGDEIHGDLVFENGDVGLLQDSGHQNAFNLLTGHVVGMNNAPAGMAALPGEIEVSGSVAGQIKVGPEID